MSDEPQPPKESLKGKMEKLALWKWGLLTIFGSLVSCMVMTAGRPTRRLTSAQKAELYGVYTATGLLLLVGIVMIAVHFIRRNKPK